jgi:hypothetical protein
MPRTSNDDPSKHISRPDTENKPAPPAGRTADITNPNVIFLRLNIPLGLKSDKPHSLNVNYNILRLMRQTKKTVLREL